MSVLHKALAAILQLRALGMEPTGLSLTREAFDDLTSTARAGVDDVRFSYKGVMTHLAGVPVTVRTPERPDDGVIGW